MTLLEKIDTVMQFLYEHSGKNPNFPYIKDGLKDKEIDEGEIRDILIKLKKDGLMYCEGGGIMNTEYSDYGHYLISFDGKFFWETEGGFIKKMSKDASENTRLQTLETSQQIQSGKLTSLTRWIAVATCVAALYYILVIIELVYKYLKC